MLWTLAGSIVRQTLLKATAEGRIVIRLEDDRTYNSQGCVEGSVGRRRRIAGSISSLSLDDSVLIVPAGSEEGAGWVKEDAPAPVGPGKDPVPPLPPPVGPVTATTWEKVLELSVDRPLLRLSLYARTPAAAQMLSGLAQPLSPERIVLTVNVGGNLKGGGTAHFMCSEVKPNHPAKPLQTAQVLFNALESDTGYEAALDLDFGVEGRTGLRDALEDLAREAPDGISPKGDFDIPAGEKQ